MDVHDHSGGGNNNHNNNGGNGAADGGRLLASQQARQTDGLGRRQLGIMMRKQWLTKKRVCCSTCCELLSPLLLMLILVIGWQLSLNNLVTTGVTHYVNQTLDVQTIATGLVTAVTTGGLQANTATLRTLAAPLLAYNGPLPVPTFSAYIQAHNLLRSGISLTNSSSIQVQLDRLSQADARFDNLINLGQLTFAPDTPAVRTLVASLNATYSEFASVYGGIFASEDAATDHALRDLTKDANWIRNNPYRYRTWALFAFKQLDLDNGIIDYTMRMNYSVLPTTRNVRNRFTLGYDANYQKYYYSGYLSLQQMIENYILSSTVNIRYGGTYPSFDTDGDAGSFPRTSSMQFVAAPMPLPAIDTNPFYSQSGPFVGLVMAMSILYPISRLMKGLVEDKESRMKETQKMMGLFQWVFMASWSITYIIIFFIVALVGTLLLARTVLSSTSAGVTFVYFYLFFISMISFAFLVSVFFNRAKVAGIVGPILVFACVMPRFAFFTTDATESDPAKYVVCLFSPTAFAFAADILMSYEGADLGLTFSTMRQDPFSFADMLGMMVLDTAIYAVLAWYFENVLPNEYGSQQKPWFLFTAAYWQPRKAAIARANEERRVLAALEGGNNNNNNSHHDDHAASSSHASNVHIEQVTSNELLSKRSVSITRLYKVFDHQTWIDQSIDWCCRRRCGKRAPANDEEEEAERIRQAQHLTVAVRDLSLDMYEGQITCLLGHNGAGKTTTISMLTGLITATSGDAIIAGSSVNQQMQDIRHSLGVCPQHNVLYDTLTVYEHLVHFATLKGVPQSIIHKAVTDKIADVGLTEKTNVYSSALSGGMKRKLSVAIALVGDSKVVFLDEPTSGMDPYSRRATWELLGRSKTENRCIVLTTHFMDEADLLGDRIAIMSNGVLRCVGSPLFLKSRYGLGYNLTLVREPTSDVSAIRNTVIHHVPDCKELSHAAGEMSFQLPLSAVGSFAALFAQLEEKPSRLGVSACGLSMTTMEEVFMKIAEQGEKERELQVEADKRERQLKRSAAAAGPASSSSAATVAIAVAPRRDVEMSEMKTSSLPPPTAGVVASGSVDDIAETKIVVIHDGPTPEDGTVTRPGTSGGQAELSHVALDHHHLAPPSSGTGVAPLGDLANASTRPYSDSRDSIGGDHPNEPSSARVSVSGNGGHDTAEHALLGSNHRETASFGRQFNELFRKRYLCALRDLKGRFFEVVLPVAIVILVLLILLLNYNPAGPSITLDANLYATESTLTNTNVYTSFASDTVIDNGILSYLNGTNPATVVGPSVPYRLYGINGITNSMDLSIYILTQYYSHGDDQRVASITFNDSITYFTPISLDLASTGVDIDALLAALNAASINTDTINALISQLLATVSPTLAGFNITSFGGVNITIAIPDGTRINLPTIIGNITIPSFLLPNGTVLVIPSFIDLLRPNGTASTITIILPDGSALNISSILDSIIITLPSNQTISLTALNNLLATLTNQTITVLPTTRSAWTLMHNSSSYHVIPAYAAEMMRSQLQLLHASSGTGYMSPSSSYAAYAANRSGTVPTASYTVRNHPLPLTVQRSLTIRAFLAVFAALFTLVPFCYLPASFVIFIVKERYVKAKHLQLVSGVNPVAYWFATFAWDCLNYFAICIMVLFVFLAYNNDAFVLDGATTMATFMLFFMYGLAAVPLSYIISFAFENHTSAQVGISGIHFVTGFILTIASFIMETIESTAATNESLKPYYRLLPPYNLGEGLIALSTRQLEALIAGTSTAAFDFDIVGRNLVYLVGECIVYFAITIIIDLGAWNWFVSKLPCCKDPVESPRVLPAVGNNGMEQKVDVEPEDEDVARERIRVEQGAGVNDLISLQHLRKVYAPRGNLPTPTVAVRDLSLGVPAGECFGFLGINGAGKTTTMSILTGDYKPTSGRAFIRNLDVVTQVQQVRQEIGYCPQFDPLLDLMTAREHLTMYARLRGIAEPKVAGVVDGLIKRLGLTKHADHVSEGYSGGNKRKLSLAIALIGDPSVVFLDEPSTGMDPVSRRFMWGVISSISKRMSVVLTTHSMEECEALCGRIGIMTQGRLQCLGSIQHLKNRFGSGYQMEINANEAQVPEVKDFVQKLFTGAVLGEYHAGRMKYQLPRQNLSLSSIFASIESSKERLGIRDYCISQSTLEQIFVSIAKSHDTPANVANSGVN